jgi:hypothetical protein
MSRSAEAKLMFGIVINTYDDDNKLPDVFYDDFDRWWSIENGAPDKSDEEARVKKEYPCPFKLVDFGHTDGELDYAIIIKQTLNVVYWGPKAIEFAPFQASEVSDLIDFCKKYKIPVIDEPAWLLGASYG